MATRYKIRTERDISNAALTVLGNTSGTNTGDSATPAETTTTIGTLISGATEKTTPVDADMTGLMDSAASNVLKKLSWANIKATLKSYFMPIIYPVGSVYINVSDSTSPATLFGFGTWVATGVGRVLVGISASDTEFDTIGETGGEKTHTLTDVESGEKGHNHTQDAHGHTSDMVGTITTGTGSTAATCAMGGAGTPTYYSISNATATNQAVGASNASSAHNNIQPYLTVYMWARTA